MKNHIVIAFVLLIILACAAHIAEAKMACAFKNEKNALDARAMQSQMMVAALSCGNQQKYNSFIKKFQAEFIECGKNLKTYFTRNYHNDADRQMNKFITSIANEASKKSLDQNSEQFCAEANHLFDKIQSSGKQNVLELASMQEFASLHPIKSCD